MLNAFPVVSFLFLAYHNRLILRAPSVYARSGRFL
jgi:hypothetical protein